VAHSGLKASGSFIQTLVLTDIATGWTECAPLLVREQRLLVEVLTEMREHLPFAVLGFDTDNDSVFMNETVQEYCRIAGVEFTRCRPYRKNDQAWVEQKNGSVVRRMVGYRRFEGLEAAAGAQPDVQPTILGITAVNRKYKQPMWRAFRLNSRSNEARKVTKMVRVICEARSGVQIISSRIAKRTSSLLWAMAVVRSAQFDWGGGGGGAAGGTGTGGTNFAKAPTTAAVIGATWSRIAAETDFSVPLS
jgi:hypothetical protein